MSERCSAIGHGSDTATIGTSRTPGRRTNALAYRLGCMSAAPCNNTCIPCEVRQRQVEEWATTSSDYVSTLFSM